MFSAPRRLLALLIVFAVAACLRVGAVHGGGSEAPSLGFADEVLTGSLGQGALDTREPQPRAFELPERLRNDDSDGLLATFDLLMITPSSGEQPEASARRAATLKRIAELRPLWPRGPPPILG